MYSSILATIAILLTFYNLYLLNTHNKKSLKPYLLINTDIDTAEAFIEIYLINKGVGPCIITDFNLIYRGEQIDINDYSYFRKRIDETAIQIAKSKGYASEISIRRSIRQIENNRTALAVNERARFLRVEFEDYEVLRDLVANIKINCEYKSIYNQKNSIQYISGVK